MQKQIMILDGYNLLHKLPHWAKQLDVSLEQGREALLGYCRRWMSTRGDVWLFCVVFDGDSSVSGGLRTAGSGIRVFFSRSGQTADDRLLAIVDEFGPAFAYTVVSDDRYVQEKARLLGASVMSCERFALRLDGERQGARRRQRREEHHEQKVSGAEAASITDELRRLWGGS